MENKTGRQNITKRICTYMCVWVFVYIDRHTSTYVERKVVSFLLGSFLMWHTLHLMQQRLEILCNGYFCEGGEEKGH